MRICGVNLPLSKRLIIALTYIKGIGNSTAEKILADLKINPSIRTKEVSDETAKAIEDYILEKSDQGVILYGAALINEVNNRKKLYISLRTRRGNRLENNLPTRGQRTKTNARNARQQKKGK